MRYIIISLLAAFLSIPSEPIHVKREIVSCSPADIKAAFAADVFSVKDGDWYNGATWSTGKVPNEADNIVASHNLTSNRNVIIRGKLKSNKMKLTFVNVNESAMVGSGMDPITEDVGLWVMGGQLELEGEAKTPWTNLLGSALKGSLSITLRDATGWKEGDEIFVVPTDSPVLGQADWDDVRGAIDPFAAKFERRIITAVSGNTVSFAQPLLYDHLAVTATSMNKVWTAEVGNLTRSVVIEGTKTGRSHIFVRSNRTQVVKYIEGRYLGARKKGYRSGELVNGRYGIHFHHCEDGSIGSIVEGNAFHDLGNRMYVPHMSNGITFKNNVAFAGLEAMFWWDFQDQSHSITYDGNLAALRLVNGNFGGSVGFELGQGDDNKCINNVAVYLHHGDPHQQGAFAWNTNNVGVWVFFNNLSHSNITALFVWQNVADNHANEDYWSYNNVQGMHHGAYINSYMYRGGGHYKSLVKFEAIQGNTVPLFQNVIFDGGNTIDYLVEVLTSPNRGVNVLQNCTFIGYKKSAVLMNTSIFTGEPVAGKIVDIVMPKGNLASLTAFSPTSIYNSYFRVQPGSAQSYQMSQAGRSNVADFNSTVYAKGDGLIGKYYNGKDFNALAFQRLDPMIKFQQWSVDREQSPNGVHHLIKTGQPYSVVWDGYYKPSYSGQHQFAFESFGGVRLTVDGAVIFQRWNENQDRVMFDGPLIALQQDKLYKIKIEHFNIDGERGVQFYTKQGGQYFNVPPSQLYSESGSPEQPPVNRAPTVSAGPDITTTDTLFKISGMAVDPDGNLQTVKWSGPADITLTQNLSEAADVMVKAKPGRYTLKLTGTDKLNASAFDEMILTINGIPRDTIITPPVTNVLFANAGPDTTISGTSAFLDGSRSSGRWTAINWYKDSGPSSWNARAQNDIACEMNRLVKGTYVFRLRLKDATGAVSEDRVTVIVGEFPASFKSKEQTGTVTCLNGVVITFTVPAGKYTSTSQALADAQALQELNGELAKCPAPLIVIDLPESNGKKVYIFKTGETYQAVFK